MLNRSDDAAEKAERFYVRPGYGKEPFMKYGRNYRFKLFLMVVFCLFWLCLPSTAVYADTTGELGDSISYVLTSAGVLNITGSGDMWDFTYEGGGNVSPFDGNLNIRKVVIGAGITSVGKFLCAHCKNLTEVSLPESLIRVGTSAFTDTGIKKVTIPEKVTTLEGWAFGLCPGLTAVTIPASVTDLYPTTFAICRNLNSIQVNSSNSSYASVSGVVFSKDMKTLVCYPSGKAGAYTIPGSVTEVEEYAFYNAEKMTSLTIPDSVETIHTSTFESSNALSKVTVPGSIEAITGRAFYGCSALSQVVVQRGVKTLQRASFAYCGSLKTVILPETVTTMQSSVFLNCENLERIYIPPSVVSIDDNPFQGSSQVTIYGIKPSVASRFASKYDIPFVDITGFGEAGGWTPMDEADLVLPGDLKEVDVAAFMNTKAEVIVIPEQVTAIRSRAFANNKQLREIYIPASVTTIADTAFDGCTEDLVIYGWPGTTAHDYAAENMFPFEVFFAN